MATAATHIPRFTLPTRLHLKKATAGDMAAMFELAGRIAELPGTRVTESGATVPRCVDVFLAAATGRRRQRSPELRLCSISSSGIRVTGLHDWDRHQVLTRRWGHLGRDGEVLLFLPRDADELETCWQVLVRAYNSLAELVGTGDTKRTVSNLDLPRFSRTMHQ